MQPTTRQISREYFEGMGTLVFNAVHCHEYGFTSKGRGTIKSKTKYLVYFVPDNDDLPVQDFHSGTRKADASRVFKKESKAFHSLSKLVDAELEKQKASDNVIFVDFEAKRRLA